MAYAHSPPGLTAQHRSQSDSNLLVPKQDMNGLYAVREEGAGGAGSMDDMDVAEAQKRNKNFFYRLVRPWKWGRRFRKKGRQAGAIRSQSVDFTPLHSPLVADPHSITVQNPIHRSPHFIPDPHSNGFNGQQGIRPPPPGHPGYSYIHSPIVHAHSASLPHDPSDASSYAFPSPRHHLNHPRVSTSSAPGNFPPGDHAFFSPPAWGAAPVGGSIPEGFEGSMMGANVSQEQQAAWAAANGGQQQPQDKRVAFLAEATTIPGAPRSILKTSSHYEEDSAHQRQTTPPVRESTPTRAAFQGSVERRRNKKEYKASSKYVVYSPDDDDSSDEEGEADGINPEYYDEDDGVEDQVLKFGNKVIRSDSIALLRLKRTHDRMEIESELYTLRHDDAITMMSL
jgi:hypothetical protein